MSDPLKYFRIEGNEIAGQLQSGLLELERGGARADLTARLLRLAHTLKGAARVVRQLEIASLAHRFEELLLPLRDAERQVSRAEVEALLGPVDVIASLLAALGPTPPTEGRASTLPPRDRTPTSPPAAARSGLSGAAVVDDHASATKASVEQVEELMASVSELGLQLSEVTRALPSIDAARAIAAQLRDGLSPRRLDGSEGMNGLRALATELEARLGKVERQAATSLERASRELGLVRDRVDQLRLVAASSIFGALERATRDAAVSLGKQASFQARGGDMRLDAEVLSVVQRALVQAVRNAVAHGIESAEDRTASGKPRAGLVSVEVERTGKRICFTCRDDGRGVNLAAVAREAQRMGKATLGAVHDKEQLVELLLRGGITTRSHSDELAGRGVGLDLIREALSSVGGDVELTTESGRGTSVALSVPASLSAVEILLVEVASEHVALPLGCVAAARRVSSSELSFTTRGASLDLYGELLPFVPLRRLLGRPEPREGDRARPWTTLVVRASSGALALGVETLLGSETAVVRLLPPSANVDRVVAGVTLDVDGNPRLFLDPDEVVALARNLPAPPPREPVEPRSVLVVDDSLTTRMLEQSILEAAGYRVTLATSGEQGLALARRERFDLFLVDVEMPGMNGFDFIEQVRSDPQLSGIPALLVTSRTSTDDLARGRAVGASGHIAKAEFDQLDFLDQVARLLS